MGCQINCHYCNVGTSYVSACGGPSHPNVTPHSERARPILVGHVLILRLLLLLQILHLDPLRVELAPYPKSSCDAPDPTPFKYTNLK